MSKLIDLTGKRFGRWTVLALHPKRRRYGRAKKKAVEALWLGRCDCGTERLVFGNNLRHGLSTGCGCIRREKIRERSTKHGHARRGKHTSIYDRWVSMRQRCRNRNNSSYHNYGARGFDVPEDWDTFVGYYADVGEPPPGLTLDRTDNDRGYGPDNWRWATPIEQVRNRRPSKRKARRADVADIRAYAASLARAASASGEAAP